MDNLIVSERLVTDLSYPLIAAWMILSKNDARTCAA